MILITGIILSIVGMAGLYAARLTGRKAVASTEAGDARLLATTAIEHALATIEAVPTWSVTFPNADAPPAVAYNGGTFEWRMTPNADSSYTITATGKKGGAVRILSAQFSTGGGNSAALAKAVYAAGGVSTSGNTYFTNGPLASGATVTNNGAITGNVESLLFVNLGSITGTSSLALPVTVPPASTFDSYYGIATPISYSSTSGTIDSRLISADSNPFGARAANGVYWIDVPAAAKLTISRSRIVATLVITLQPGAALQIQHANSWEKPAGNYPVLLVKARASATIDLTGSATPLSESDAAVNFNPTGTPYLGVPDSDLTDSYPSEIRGLIQIFGSGASVSAGSDLNLIGALITDGTLSIAGPARFTLDTTLATSPPVGYGTMRGVSDWKWIVLP